MECRSFYSFDSSSLDPCSIHFLKKSSMQGASPEMVSPELGE
jgi:hypothetical protein